MGDELQVFRENLADWIKHPHLRETLTGAIVRVALTTSSQPTGEGSMCRITDVIDGAPYTCALRSANLMGHELVPTCNVLKCTCSHMVFT